jgi:hypothetical protein
MAKHGRRNLEPIGGDMVGTRLLICATSLRQNSQRATRAAYTLTIVSL